MAMTLRRADLPDPLPPRFHFHMVRSRIKMPPPGTPQEELSYKAKRIYIRNDRTYDSAMLKWRTDKDNVLSQLSFGNEARQDGPRTYMYGRVSKSQKFLGNGVYQDSMGLDSQDSVAQQWYQYQKDRLRLPPLYDSQSFHDKDVSRRTTFAQRPAAFRLLRAARRGDHVIFPAFDRLGCSAADAAATLRHFSLRGVTTHIVGFPMNETYDPNNPFTMMLIAAFAMASQFEWQNNSVRRKNATGTLKRSRKWSGNMCPYGFMPQLDDDGTPVLNSKGQPVYIVSEVEQEFLDAGYRAWKSGWTIYEVYLAATNMGVPRFGVNGGLDKLYAAIGGIHDERMRHGGLEQYEQKEIGDE